MESKPAPPDPYSPVIAVISGDLVGSKKLGSDRIEAVMNRLAATAGVIADMAGADTRFTRFRGDGWQIVLARAGWVLRACLLILADLRASGVGAETRISAGIGSWTSLGTRDLSDASGSAFFVSGDHLDTIPNHRRLAIAGGSTSTGRGTPDTTWQAAIFDLVEWQSARWSQPQAEAMAMALRQDWTTQEELAQRLGITRQAMHARLTGAGFQALDNALAAFENHRWEAPA